MAWGKVLHPGVTGSKSDEHSVQFLQFANAKSENTARVLHRTRFASSWVVAVRAVRLASRRNKTKLTQNS